MTTYSAAASHVPTHHYAVPVSSWATSWADRPRDAMRVGLVAVSQADVETARAEATKRAWRLHPDDGEDQARADAHNDEIIVWLLARGTCDPEDDRHPWVAMPEENIRAALTPEGMRAMFDAWVAFSLATSPIGDAADDDDVETLAALLAGGAPALAALPARRRAETRRLLAAALALLLEGNAQDGAAVRDGGGMAAEAAGV